MTKHRRAGEQEGRLRLPYKRGERRFYAYFLSAILIFLSVLFIGLWFLDDTFFKVCSFFHFYLAIMINRMFYLPFIVTNEYIEFHHVYLGNKKLYYKDIEHYRRRVDEDRVKIYIKKKGLFYPLNVYSFHDTDANEVEARLKKAGVDFSSAYVYF